MGDILVREAVLLSLVTKKLQQSGLNARHSEIVANVLVHADLRGVRSHGVIRTEHYVTRLKHGSLNGNPHFSIRNNRPGAALLNADAGMGHVACLQAMEKAVECAKNTGIAMCGVENGSHCGALSYFVLRAVHEGKIGIALTQTDMCVTPFGGAKAFFGTNPIAFAFPAQRHQPIVLDMATSNAAWGKLLHARERQEMIPDDWAVDKDGMPTTNPHEAMALLPFGGAKGYGLALVIDVLSGILLGGQYGPHITKMYGEYEKPRELNSLMIAIDPEAFYGLKRFTDQIDAMIDELHAQPPVAGTKKVFLPGELENEKEKENRCNGIPVLENVYQWLTS